MAIQQIRLLGDPALRTRCKKVSRFDSPGVRACIANLRDTLYDFRARSGFGRGIAAPQIGVPLQIIFIHVDTPLVIINPGIVSPSRRMISLWDDCFSFPELLAKVRRHHSITVEYRDEKGATQSLRASGALSELLQHEIDHLHGILAIDRAIDSKHIILRSEWEKRFTAQQIKNVS